MGDAWQINDQGQAYFFTFQVVGWADIFTRKRYRDIILDSFKFCRQNKGMLLYAYVIMSNHVHAIIQSQEGDLSALIRDFKRHTSSKIIKAISTYRKECRREWLLQIFENHASTNKRTGKHQLWTHFNHAVEMGYEEIFNSRLHYIHQNPVKAGIVDCEFEYLYSSARNFSDLPALIEIDPF